ncbi:MFS transporter [Oscillatoriales cyanobacterium LEGE 11467]|uniref:MFS transporter n=1 Tax=Zarconia navalis LEGE 11467 TaxID=1828826 RepID=A0A928Z9G7_9CYAN|nr:MFS transporter [Zarconia navalis]MBE9041663.1 MFS transporter [Zarconia navalis LEGE 11467]
MNSSLNGDRLCLRTQIAYGAGDFGPSMAGNTLMVFFFFFLTTIAGLSPALAGSILLVSNIWSALSTIVVGILSDRTQSRWGRRRVWMFCSAPILGLGFFLLWWLPPFQDWALFCYYLGAALLFQTGANGFLIPYGALVTDLSEKNNEHVRLNSLRFGFSLAGCIAALLLAQGLSYYLDEPRQLWITGAIGGVAIVVSIFACCWGTTEQRVPTANPVKLNWGELKLLLGNQPFTILMGIYALSWMALHITPAILPYFIVHCLELDTSAITSIVLVMQVTSLASLFIWEPLSQQLGKRTAFWLGSSIWIFGQFALFYLQPGQIYLMYGVASIIGLGMGATYVVPPSMLPETIDWDELRTGQRREGLYYSILMFLYQVILALGLFFLGQWLAGSGFQETIPGQGQILQPHSALVAIRQVSFALPVLAMLGSLALTYFYPINSAVHQDTTFQLQQRRVAASNSLN